MSWLEGESKGCMPANKSRDLDTVLRQSVPARLFEYNMYGIQLSKKWPNPGIGGTRSGIASA